ncbi:MAG TPA: MerR family transcriptional regulator, partial [Acidimicrobiales bacterium]|nr:MerR family transcriptional regulator [Acidimicrobiales bacterium]
SQGLLDPERTPSGYRKFYEGDIDRLRWILRQQKEHYLPLKVIKDRLDDGEVPAAAPAPGAERNGAPASGPGISRPAVTVALALDDRPASPPVPPAPAEAPAARAPAPAAPPAPSPADDGDETARLRRPVPPPRPDAPAPGGGRTVMPAGEPPEALRRPAPSRAGHRSARPAPAPEPGSVSLTADELAEASGLATRDVRDLERYGLLEGFSVGDATYYDADGLVVARTAAGFLQHGIEARHMRTYKVAVDREAGLFEQIVLPLLKQRNPDAKRRATQTVVELMRLGDDMRRVLLARELRDHLPPP